MSFIKEFSSVPLEELPKVLPPEKLVAMLETMLRIRLFEEKAEELYLYKGLIKGPLHLYFGQEAIATGVAFAIDSDDIIISHHRGHGHAIAMGVPFKNLMAELFGKATGTCKGLSGSMHIGIAPENNILYASAIVGSGVPIAVGVALAVKYRNQRRAVISFFGDGAVNTGAFHEAANMASLWKLPVVFACENNQYGMGTRVDRATPLRNLAERAQAYNMPGVVVDGNDPVAVFIATREAVMRAKNGEGPTFVEYKTYRQKGHGVYDLAPYRPREEVEEWLKRDPILLFKDKLMRLGIVKEEEITKIEENIRKELEEAVKFAMESPILSFDELKEFVYA